MSHDVRTAIDRRGARFCARCNQPVRWVGSTDPRDDSIVGHWTHDTVEAAMARHPSGKRR